MTAALQRATIAVALPTLALVALAPAISSGSRAFAQPSAPAGATGEPAAVLSFINISGDSADDWIGTGIAESLASDLNRAGCRGDPRRDGVRAAGDGGGPGRAGCHHRDRPDPPGVLDRDRRLSADRRPPARHGARVRRRHGRRDGRRDGRWRIQRAVRHPGSGRRAGTCGAGVRLATRRAATGCGATSSSRARVHCPAAPGPGFAGRTPRGRTRPHGRSSRRSIPAVPWAVVPEEVPAVP